MRLGWLMCVLVSSAAPPCQESNPDFDREDASATGSGGTQTDTAAATTTSTTSTTTTSSGSATGETTDASTTTSTGGGTTTGGGCPDPMVVCAGECVDTATDINHCGMCNNKCNPAQEICQDSMCMPS